MTRAEILDVNLDQATRDAMLQQLNAERERRAQVTRAEGQKRAVELSADAELYAAEQVAKARRIQADAEAYATEVVAAATTTEGVASSRWSTTTAPWLTMKNSSPHSPRWMMTSSGT